MKCFMILRSPTDNENANFVMLVMPTWIAGIQVRKDASGDIRVNLDSGTPCWNEAIEGALLEATEAPLPTYFRRSPRRLRRPDMESIPNLKKCFFPSCSS